MNDFGHYQRLGFTSNPFRTLSRAEWGQIAFLTPDIQQLLHNETAHLQLIGDMGSGKTTTLMGIQAACQTGGQSTIYEYLALGQRRFKTDFKQQMPDVFLIDEAQRLWHWEKHRLLRLCKTNLALRLIFSSHADLSGWFQQRNLSLITYDVENLPIVSLGDLLTRRLDFFRQNNSSSPLIEFTPDAIIYLDEIFSSDRRSMESFLFEVFTLINDIQPLSVDFLKECRRKVSEAEDQGVQSVEVKRQIFRTWGH